MIYQVESLIEHGRENLKEIDDKWVAARPKRLSTIDNLLTRLDAAWMVFTGKADAITWYKQ